MNNKDANRSAVEPIPAAQAVAGNVVQANVIPDAAIDNLFVQHANLQRMVLKQGKIMEQLSPGMELFHESMTEVLKQYSKSTNPIDIQLSQQLVPCIPGLSTCSSSENGVQPNVATKKPSDVGKIKKVPFITAKRPYYSCLENDGDFDSTVKDDDYIPETKESTVEVPGWRIKPYPKKSSLIGVECMDDKIYELKHKKLELIERNKKERRQKRLDMQRQRELDQIENLKRGRNKKILQEVVKEKELTTLVPNPDNVNATHITDDVPVMSFCINLPVLK